MLATYTDLLAALATFSVRSDQTALWPTCVVLAEAQMNRELKVRRMEVRSEAVISDEYSDVPTDFAGVRAFLLSSPARELKFHKPDDMHALKAGVYAATGAPVAYSIVGDEFRYLPAPDGEYIAELTYFARLPALADEESNWLLSDHPDAYLYGSLVQFGIMTEDERLPAWGQAYANALSAIRAADSNERYGARLAMKTRRMG